MRAPKAGWHSCSSKVTRLGCGLLLQNGAKSTVQACASHTPHRSESTAAGSAGCCQAASAASASSRHGPLPAQISCCRRAARRPGGTWRARAPARQGPAPRRCTAAAAPPCTCAGDAWAGVGRRRKLAACGQAARRGVPQPDTHGQRGCWSSLTLQLQTQLPGWNKPPPLFLPLTHTHTTSQAAYVCSPRSPAHTQATLHTCAAAHSCRPRPRR